MTACYDIAMRHPGIWQRISPKIIAPIANIKARLELRSIAAGEYFAQPIPKYISQLAGAKSGSIEQVYGSIKDSKAASRFGSTSLEEFSYWAWRSCGIAAAHMIITSLTTHRPTTMQLIDQGVLLGGYNTITDAGWFHQPLVELLNQYNIPAKSHRKLYKTQIAAAISQNHYAIASVKSPHGGHLLLIYGVRINQKHHIDGYFAHDPYDLDKPGEAIFMGTQEFKDRFNNRGIIVKIK